MHLVQGATIIASTQLTYCYIQIKYLSKYHISREQRCKNKSSSVYILNKITLITKVRQTYFLSKLLCKWPFAAVRTSFQFMGVVLLRFAVFIHNISYTPRLAKETLVACPEFAFTYKALRLCRGNSSSTCIS